MITPDIAKDVWDILCYYAGASTNEIDREQFVGYAVGRDEIPEYRFRGLLGFGGKVRLLNGGYWHVYYYPEDVNEEREAIRHRTNLALSVIPTTNQPEQAGSDGEVIR